MPSSWRMAATTARRHGPGRDENRRSDLSDARSPSHPDFLIVSRLDLMAGAGLKPRRARLVSVADLLRRRKLMHIHHGHPRLALEHVYILAFRM